MHSTRYCLISTGTNPNLNGLHLRRTMESCLAANIGSSCYLGRRVIIAPAKERPRSASGASCVCNWSVSLSEAREGRHFRSESPIRTLRRPASQYPSQPWRRSLIHHPIATAQCICKLLRLHTVSTVVLLPDPQAAVTIDMQAELDRAVIAQEGFRNSWMCEILCSPLFGSEGAALFGFEGSA